MQMFSFSISDDPKRHDVSTGFVRGETVEQALLVLNDVRANVYELPDDFEWPDESVNLIYHVG